MNYNLFKIMGTITSKDTRRISFDNTSALNLPIVLPKSIEDERDIMDYTDLPSEHDCELLYQETKKPVGLQEGDETSYWGQRIESLKKEHQIINKIIETEYDKKIASNTNVLQDQIIKHERIQKVKPCFDWRVKIVKCYEENPHQPLVCSAAVQAFTKCVASFRMEE